MAHKSITYTPQEMIIKSRLEPVGASFCMFRDFVLIWRGNYAIGRHIDNMNEYLGI